MKITITLLFIYTSFLIFSLWEEFPIYIRLVAIPLFIYAIYRLTVLLKSRHANKENNE